jgi:hypothetical protein
VIISGRLPFQRFVRTLAFTNSYKSISLEKKKKQAHHLLIPLSPSPAAAADHSGPDSSAASCDSEPDSAAVLSENSLSLLAFDGEIPQVEEATSGAMQPLLSAACLDLLKLNAGLSFSLSACDAGRTHTVLHAGARLLRVAERPSHLKPDPVMLKFMQDGLKRARLQSSPARKVRRSAARCLCHV